MVAFGVWSLAVVCLWCCVFVCLVVDSWFLVCCCSWLLCVLLKGGLGLGCCGRELSVDGVGRLVFVFACLCLGLVVWCVVVSRLYVCVGLGGV